VKILYVTDRKAIGNERFERLLETLRGAPQLIVQLRENEATDRERLQWAELARARLLPEVPLFVNRRLDIALTAGADGVHLPADGLPLSRVRADAPRSLRVGASTHSAAEALHALEDGADLVVIGPIFETPSKAAFGPPLGPAALAPLAPREAHGAEVFAIGGMNEQRLPELDAYRDRLAGVAGIRLIQEAADPRGVVERIARL